MKRSNNNGCTDLCRGEVRLREGARLPKLRITVLQKMVILGLLSLAVAVPDFIWAQQDSLPLPTTTGIMDRKDAGALTEIAAYLQAVSSAGWHDLEGSGTLTFPDGDARSAELYLRGAGYTRLDIEMDGGTRSLRISKTFGSFRSERGAQGAFYPATAGVGLVAFPRIWTQAITSPRISLIDHGNLSAMGRTLHRITMECFPLLGSVTRNGQETSLDIATDLYFDPTAHLLLFSDDAVAFKESPNKLFNRITQYDHYQLFGGVGVPTMIEQTLDGQEQWTLQLSQVSINVNPSESTFVF